MKEGGFRKSGHDQVRQKDFSLSGYAAPRNLAGAFHHSESQESNTEAANILFTPDYPPCPNPEMRPAADAPKYRWMKRDAALFVEGDIPPRLDVFKHHHLKALSTPTRAAQAHAPVLAVLARQNEISARQSLRQTVALNYRERATW